MLNKFLFILFLLLSFRLVAQQNPVMIDSLKRELSKAKTSAEYANKNRYSDGANATTNNAIVAVIAEQVLFFSIQKQKLITNLYGLGNG